MLRKKELVRALSDATHITYKDSRIIIDALLGILRGAIIVGEDVELSGVGFFTRQDIAPRKAEMGMLNPKTQEFGMRKPRHSYQRPVFQFNKNLKQQIREESTGFMGEVFDDEQ